MSARTEKKLEALENDVKAMEERQKEMAERLRSKKAKVVETHNLAIVEIVREKNVTISDLKAILSGGKTPKTTITTAEKPITTRKEITENEEEII